MEKYFKIVPGNPTFENVQSMVQKIKKTDKINRDFAKSIGCNNNPLLFDANHYVSGAIAGWPFDKHPENWRQAVRGKYYGYYMPIMSKAAGKANKEVLDKMKELPFIRRSDFNALIGYDGFLAQPGIKWYPTIVLIAVPVGGWAGDYNGNEDMIEILGSEYKILVDEQDKLEKDGKETD